MDKTVSAADANRRFSGILRGVREGQSYVVTSHGRPVARIIPPHEGGGDRTGGAARASLLARLQHQPVQNVGRWSREELYDRGGGDK